MATDAEHADDVLSTDVASTSSYFSAIVELIPAKYYIQDELEESANTYSGKKKKLKPENKKLLAKKAKLLKLDPSKHKSISELQQEIELKENELLSELSSNGNQLKPIKVSTIPSASIEELREKLHSKMDHLRGKRKILEGEDKTNYRIARNEKKEKDANKKKKVKESDNIKRATEIEEQSLSKPKEVKNDMGEVVFSKFDFATSKNNNNKSKKKDMKTLLHIAEKKQEKIKDLENVDKEKANELKKKIAWDKAVKKAEGIKLKDDPKLLKKTLKRKEKMKDHSRKKWQERSEHVESLKQDKQKQRKEHLKERREEKFNKKRGIKKKKSKPGF